MADLHFKGLSVDQMIVIGDAIALAKQWDVAGGVYRHAIGQPLTPNQRRKLLNRLGILGTRKIGSYNLLKHLIDLEPDCPDLFASEGLITWLKATPFYDDAKFARLADKHSGLLPIANWHWNLQTHAWAVGHALPLDGELVELGVFKGHSTLFTVEYLDFADKPRTFYLYDTFDGIPEDQLDPGWAENNKRAYQGQFSFEEVRDRFAHIPNIKVIKGRVPEILRSPPWTFSSIASSPAGSSCSTIMDGRSRTPRRPPRTPGSPRAA